jgi:hypothetical protein
LFAQLHAPDLTYHFHGDHLIALLLKYSAAQLNTLVNFESALLGLDGQFSVGGNTLILCITEDALHKNQINDVFRLGSNFRKTYLR